MRFIRDIIAEKLDRGRPVISFEFFPPRTEEGRQDLLEATIPALSALQPDYCSVTYGAGGGTREKTLEIVSRIQNDHGLPAMAHLTCVGATQDHVQQTLEQAQALGIRNILALRGDPPTGASEFVRTDGGFEFAWELVEFVKGFERFSIGVAGFPEGHPTCSGGRHVDWQNLKSRIDSGADFVVTQLFYDNRDFLEFRDHMTTELGVSVPIVAGILPILSTKQIKRFTGLSGARLPDSLLSRLDELADNDEKVTELGIEYSLRQCRELLEAGVAGLHFYTLNRHQSVTAILRDLGLATSA